jgi:hypothetical protein
VGITCGLTGIFRSLSGAGFVDNPRFPRSYPESEHRIRCVEIKCAASPGGTFFILEARACPVNCSEFRDSADSLLPQVPILKEKSVGSALVPKANACG